MVNVNLQELYYKEVFIIKKKIFLVFLSVLMCLLLSGCFKNQGPDDNINTESIKESVKDSNEESMYGDYVLGSDELEDEFDEEFEDDL